MYNRNKIYFIIAFIYSLIFPFTSNGTNSLDSIQITNNDTITTIKVVDTLNTADKFTKIVIYDNYTWQYYNIGCPVIDNPNFYECWDTAKIHPYKEYPIKNIPDSIILVLVDSLHNYYAPIVGKVNSKYCFRGKREHQGTDIKIAIGDPIKAAFDGQVRICMPSRLTGGYGNLIIIRHNNGLETYYGHLSQILVKDGELVKAGEIIGLGGNTGRSTGHHLHFEVRYCGNSFDPERIIDFTTGNLRSNAFNLKKHYFSIYSHYGQTEAQSIAASQRIIYVIKSGDTLSSIASKYNTTVSNICKLNNISTKTVLRVGNRITVR